MIFVEIFSILAPVFICVTLGYIWVKSGKPYDTDLITAIVTYLGTPCLVFSSLVSVQLHPDLLIEIGLSALYANLLFFLIGGLILALFRLPQRAFLPVISFPNIGNVGIPICYLAFGDEGLALGVTFFAIYAAFQLTVGVAFVSGTFTFRSLVTMPVIPATVLAFLFFWTGTPAPDWLKNTTDILGNLTIPLMLLTLGVSLSKLQIHNLKLPFFLSLLRLSLGFCVGLLLASLLHFDGASEGVVILQCSMPTAVFCYLFAQKYQQRPEEVAGAVIISSLMSFSLLPVILWYIL